MQAQIRDALPSDIETIAEFNSLLATETEGSGLSAGVAAAGAAAIIDDPSKGRYWIAEHEGRAVGQILVTYEWSDWRNGMLWWIQSVYVRSDFRRKGVCSALYRHVESLASRHPDVCGIRLYVERDNMPAQKAYSSVGMSMTEYLVMERLFKGDK